MILSFVFCSTDITFTDNIGKFFDFDKKSEVTVACHLNENLCPHIVTLLEDPSKTNSSNDLSSTIKKSNNKTFLILYSGLGKENTPQIDPEELKPHKIDIEWIGTEITDTQELLCLLSAENKESLYNFTKTNTHEKLLENITPEKRSKLALICVDIRHTKSS